VVYSYKDFQGARYDRKNKRKTEVFSVIISTHNTRFCRGDPCRRASSYASGIVARQSDDAVWRSAFYLDLRRLRDGAYRPRHCDLLVSFRTGGDPRSDTDRGAGSCDGRVFPYADRREKDIFEAEEHDAGGDLSTEDRRDSQIYRLRY